MKRKTQRTT